METKKISIISLGCPKNLVDSEIMLGAINSTQHQLTDKVDEAHVIVVNTCAFIDSAKEEAINTILECAEFKHTGSCEKIVVCGCMAERYHSEILKELPEVDAVLGTGFYGEITKSIEDLYKEEMGAVVRYNELSRIDYLEKTRYISDTLPYKYIKISEGCDNWCTYCIIPSLRGKFRSRRIENIVKEAEGLVKNGCKEIILIAQDTTRYGLDLYGERRLVGLIQKLTEMDELERIRLLYCYPDEVDDSLIKEMKENNKLCNYLDIPIQHISESVLKRMGRRGTENEIRELIVKLKHEIPDIIIRTSIIVGFPEETEEEFDELCQFINEAEFNCLGAFTYSREEGTKASEMENQIDEGTKLRRQEKLMMLQQEVQNRLNNNRVGKIYKTLLEGIAEDGIFYYGRSYAEAPEIDGKIYMTSPEPLVIGMLYDVKILNVDGYDLIGEVIL